MPRMDRLAVITVQLAISNTLSAYSLRDLLLREGEFNVVIVDRPDPRLPGLIVVEAGSVGELLNSEDPTRFIVITRGDTDELSRLWRAGFHFVVFDEDFRIAYIAILAAKQRFLATMRQQRESPMHLQGAASGLRGPFTLSDDLVDQEVSRRSAGVYVLDDSHDILSFHVAYVGSSNVDVNNQLHVHVGAYQRFMYEYCPSPRVAFEKECSLFHDFESQGNLLHPRRPSQSGWQCPRCRLFA